MLHSLRTASAMFLEAFLATCFMQGTEGDHALEWMEL